MNTINIGNYIRELRKQKNMTQIELSDALGISFQAVSKWETGTTLPDTSILLSLSEILDTSVDKILLAGQTSGRKKGIKISNIIEGFNHIDKIKSCFGEESSFYKGLIKGINQEMNIDLITYMQDPKTLEVLYTEVIIQYIISGYKVDFVEVQSYIKSDKMLNIIKKYIERYQ